MALKSVGFRGRPCLPRLRQGENLLMSSCTGSTRRRNSITNIIYPREEHCLGCAGWIKSWFKWRQQQKPDWRVRNSMNLPISSYQCNTGVGLDWAEDSQSPRLILHRWKLLQHHLTAISSGNIRILAYENNFFFPNFLFSFLLFFGGESYFAIFIICIVKKWKLHFGKGFHHFFMVLIQPLNSD